MPHYKDEGYKKMWPVTAAFSEMQINCIPVIRAHQRSLK